MTPREILQTPRLRLRELTDADAPFIFELLNERSFIDNIGDRGVRTLDDAVGYIHKGPGDSYARHGYGLWLVELKASGEALGVCGLMHRDTLPYTDIGYAFLPRHWSRGYAVESCAAVRDHALRTLAMPRLLAIVSPGNEASVKVLERIGLRFEGKVTLPQANEELELYAIDA
ncbi:GNAT family N-acetyltransferase [Lysobacter niastensis]|uniref:GNAT family N-acetyltransferase n=1 Tax=Lysobacter niastensis TaxID=380629 RepID=A0ABS0B6P2_9GAMM|nr:GNAT family N-acetyltransferase [Lysobacter niastensis]MBF6023337.1 GNAT family N-acetyltransferase [Lysobacter niastensis]